MAAIEGGRLGFTKDNVADLLQNLNLTAKEGDVVEFSDKEDDGGSATVEWVLVGKVLSLAMLYSTTIYQAMKPAWGNPAGLKIRSIGEQGVNLFVAEFGSKHDLDRALGGSHWMVGKHALILQHYDENLRPSEIRFDRMEI
jgi:hypothetical protein